MTEERPDLLKPKIPCEKGRILVVDDQKTIRDVFGRILSCKFTNVRVDVAVNGLEAVESFRDSHQGLILMDLNMPVMDGETAYEEIRKYCEANNREMPAVVFCTGYAPSDFVKKIVDDDPRHFLLHKPVSTQALIEVLTTRL